MKMKYSEEDIVQKFIIPFLKSKGFNQNELSFEKSFTLRLGKHTHKVNTEKQIETAQARLDILVTRDGENLFIIEAKADSRMLTDEDRDQAISYARLIHPIAPISIVTNGRDFFLYDTVSKELIKDDIDLTTYKISGSEDLRDIYEEALEYFIGYSSENLKIFCDKQIAEGASTLISLDGDRTKKFIPEIYVASESLNEQFKNFLNSDKPVFAIIGESGAGKTCSMCGLSRELIAEYPVLFYRALHLTDGLIKTIANDFNWEFSTQYDDIPLFKRLNKIFKDRKVIIFIDGIDEWNDVNKVEIIGEFAKKIRGGNFKVVLSCKSSVWDRFLISQGIPTRLSQELFPIQENPPGYFISEFSNKEFSELIAKYRNFYGFTGLFEDQVFIECKRSPFLLRIFFEVAENTRYSYLTFSSKEIYIKYYETFIEKLPPKDKEKAKYQLAKIAGILLENGTDSIGSDIVHEQLNDEIVPSLFDNNVLERVSINLDTHINFYFQKFRDFLIAFKVRRWDRMSPNDFNGELKKMSTNNVRYEAIKLFYPLADVEKKTMIDGPLRKNAETYLQFYSKVIDTHFPNLKESFSPKKISYLSRCDVFSHKSDIGFLGILNLRNGFITAYGFRPIDPSDEKILLIPLSDSYWNSKSNLPFLFGASGLHFSGSSNGFQKLDIKKEVLEGEILPQLKKIVEEYQLNEEANYYLSLELALGIIIGTLEKIHQPERLAARNASSYLPIDIETAEFGIRYQEAIYYYDDLLREGKIKEGLIKQTWNGSIVTSSYKYEPGDWDEIYRKARDAANDRIELDTKGVHYDLEIKKFFLRKALLAVKKKKHVIDETILPDKDASTINWPGFLDTYEYETMKEIVFKLFTLFLEAYKLVVEMNFPTLKNHFKLYSSMPVHYLIEVNLKENEYKKKAFYLELYKLRNDETDGNKVTVCNKGDIDFVFNTFVATLYGKIYKISTVSRIAFRHLTLGTFRKLDDIPDEFMFLRGMVYSQIKQELPDVLKELGNLYGINNMNEYKTY